MRHVHVGYAGQRSVNRSVLAAALGLLCVALLALLPAAASANAGLSVSPTFPTTVSIGSNGVSGSIELRNDNTGGDVSSTICNFGDGGSCTGAPGIIMVPSCGSHDFSASCTPAGADPDVFAIQSPASGATGTACVGRFFTASVVDVTYGTVRFTPTTGAIVLPTPTSTCRINFTFSVLKSPVLDARVAPGRQTLYNAEAAAVSDQGTSTFSRAAGTPVTVTLAPPLVTDTDPDSPANDNTPQIKGTAPAGTQTVAIYTDAACTGPLAVSGTAAAFASPGFTYVMPDDTTRTFYATGTDADGGITPCSAMGKTYVEDSTAPDPPAPTTTVPSSPANDNLPRVKGTAEAGSTVRIYTDAACTSGVVVQGGATAFASPGLGAPVANDSSTTFYATAADVAGNISGCSTTAVTYVEDSTPPSAPSPGAITPASPSNDNSPRITGTAPAGTTVKVYTDAACSASVAASGTPATFTFPGIQVMVLANSTTTFYATATDTAGNASACSPGVGPYVEDSTPPAVPTVGASQPSSPGSDNSPRIKGTAAAGSTVRIFTDGSCAGPVVAEGSAADFASPGVGVTVVDNTTTTFYSRATDAANNASACSPGLTYVEDSTAPTTLLDNTPATGNTPTFTFGSSEAGSTFECRLDTGAFAACTSPYTVAAGLPTGAHAFEVRAIDAAGNRAASVARSFTVTASSIPPPPPPAAAPRTPAQPGCLGIKGTVYVGTSAANKRSGSSKTDIMFGRGGKDTLSGASGLDCLYGDTGNDVLRGGNGNDRLSGGSGNDRLYGNAGNDRVSGQAGNDTINGSTGKDTLTGAAGIDKLTDHRGQDRFSGGAGNDRIDARDATLADRRKADRILCGAGRDVVYADPKDNVAYDCERVVRRSLPATRAY